MAASLLTARLSSMNLLLTVLLLHVTSIDGHGYLKTPRSRNLHAYLERDWEDGGGNSPYPEDCTFLFRDVYGVSLLFFVESACFDDDGPVIYPEPFIHVYVRN